MAMIAELALPFFAIIFIGFAIGRTGYVGPADAGTLIKVVFRVTMPAAIFLLMSKTDGSVLAQATFAPIYFLCAILILGASYGVGRRVFGLVRPDAGLVAFGTTLGNAVFLGLPIAQAVPGWAETYVILMLIEGCVVITLASILVAARAEDNPANASKAPTASFGEIIRRPLTNPLVLATLGGLIFGLLPLQLPSTLSDILGLLGRTAGPLALLSLGLFLSGISFDLSVIRKPPLVMATFGKLIILPALFYAGLRIAGITDPVIVGPSLLFTVVPTGVVVFMQASERGRYQVEIANLLAMTTIISLFTISLVLFFFA